MDRLRLNSSVSCSSLIVSQVLFWLVAFDEFIVLLLHKNKAVSFSRLCEYFFKFLDNDYVRIDHIDH